jgi:kynurenine formamidase
MAGSPAARSSSCTPAGRSAWATRPRSRTSDQTAKFHFPGFGREAIDVLLRTRRITGIGVDTLSLDIGASSTFDVHKRLLGADRYGLENVANLSKIPPRGASVVVGVIPWEGGSGGPCRLIATY